jgi:Flp pilus assembly protein TadG
MKALLKRREKEEGAVAVLVALLMVAFLALMALVVDLGGLWDHDRDLQTAADAGAFGGALELLYTGGNTGAARAVVEHPTDGYVVRNCWPTSNVIFANLSRFDVAVDKSSVTVDLTEQNIPFFFSGVLALLPGGSTPNFTAHAHARAQVAYVTGVDKLFPVAINYMSPHRFRFKLTRSPYTYTEDADGRITSYTPEVYSFDLVDGNGDGVFDSGGTTVSENSPGGYYVTLEAIDTDDQIGTVLPNIGLYRVADPEEPLQRAGLSQATPRSEITVRVETLTTVTDTSFSAKLGSTNFTLYQTAPGLYEGTVEAPTKTSNDGYLTHDLIINKLAGNDPVARYLALHPDVPLRHVMMMPSFFDGYSTVAGSAASVSARVEVRVLTFGSEYVMKLGNQAGSGVYSGNWRIADVYRNVNVTDEIGTVPIPDEWADLLHHDLEIGGPLEPEGGAKVGQIKNGLDMRLGGTSPSFTTEELQTLPLDQILSRMPDNDPYFVIVPIVEFSALHGTSVPYKIAGFSGFYITSYTKAGDVEGVFIRWAASGEWSTDKPPGDLYMQTAVITE